MVKMAFRIGLVCLLFLACSRNVDSTTNADEIKEPAGKVANSDRKHKETGLAIHKLQRVEGNTSEFPGAKVLEKPLVSRRGLEESSRDHDDPYDENWLRNLESAQAKAKESGKLVFVDFTGSDWCPPCMALHENVLTQKLFLDFAATHLELVILDFPRERKMDETQRIYNRGLSNKYNVTGFPTVIVMDAEGKVLYRESGYGGNSAAAYVATMKKKLQR